MRDRNKTIKREVEKTTQNWIDQIHDDFWTIRDTWAQTLTPEEYIENYVFPIFQQKLDELKEDLLTAYYDEEEEEEEEEE